MDMDLYRFARALTSMTALLASLTITACTPMSTTSPQQVGSTTPQVSYKYDTDDQLMETNQRAANYCDQYNLSPQIASVNTETDGRKVVTFKCVPTSSGASSESSTSLHESQSNLSYTYRTDQGLLDAWSRAHAYCSTKGAPEMTSNIVHNSDGSSTVTFQCSAR